MNAHSPLAHLIPRSAHTDSTRGGSRQNAFGRGSWPPGSSAGLPGRVHQDQPAVERPGWRPRRRHLGWRLRHYLVPALLIIDDFAMREFTTQQADDLYELISERSRAGSMILTQ